MIAPDTALIRILPTHKAQTPSQVSIRITPLTPTTLIMLLLPTTMTTHVTIIQTTTGQPLLPTTPTPMATPTASMITLMVLTALKARRPQMTLDTNSHLPLWVTFFAR